MASDLHIRKTNRRLWRVQVPAGDFNGLKRVEKLAGELAAMVTRLSLTRRGAIEFQGAAIKARELQAEIVKGAA